MTQIYFEMHWYNCTGQNNLVTSTNETKVTLNLLVLQGSQIKLQPICEGVKNTTDNYTNCQRHKISLCWRESDTDLHPLRPTDTNILCP